jgi:fucose 4-O-acetylase-like acetyltransferase
MSKRIKWIDAAKGLGALYVIIGHFIFNGVIESLFYAFHMPLFFFLAGITLKINENDSISTFVKKKFKTIIIPYLIFSIPLFIFNCVMILSSEEKNVLLIIQKLTGIILCWKTTDYYNGVWFLPCIFMAYIISYAIIKNFKTKLYISISSILALLLGFGLDMFQCPLPLCIDTALIATFFICMAYVVKELLESTRWYLCCLYIPMSIIAFLNHNISGKRIELYSNDYGNYLLFIVSSFCGILATISFAKLRFFTNNSFLNLLGKESIYMYGSQLIFLSLISVLFPVIGIGSYSSVTKTIIGFIFCIVLILFLLGIKPLYYKILDMVLNKLPIIARKN